MNLFFPYNQKQDSQWENLAPRSLFSKKRYVVIALFLLLIGVLASYNYFLPAPEEFPTGKLIQIKRGTSLKQISLDLESQGVVRSSIAFQTFAIVYGGDRSIAAGEYTFEAPYSVEVIAWKIARGEDRIPPAKITIPEGFTIAQMIPLFEKDLPYFQKDIFLTLAEGKEGYLFPDTYFFFKSATAEEVFETLTGNFKKKIESVQEEIDASGKSLESIIIMASLIEKEASGNNDREMISGILWKRLSKGMLLQVDATFIYTIGKESKDLTVDDLASNSLYNTYKYKGLPPGPIGNPGLLSIKAAITPTPSAYLFYLHDKDGGIHYAKTFEEHKLNKSKYLR